MRISFHQISKEDNVQIASVIRSVLKEHGADKPGTVYTDPTTDALFQLFQILYLRIFQLRPLNLNVNALLYEEYHQKLCLTNEC